MEKKQTLSLDESDQTYRQIVANACGVQTGRLLSSKQEKAEPEVPDMTKNSADYTLRTTAPATVRRILTAPVKILDAPYLADDYYLNLLDWSKLNVVAVALDRSVYLWNADNGSIRPLNYQGQDAITSVRWSTDGAYLAVGTANGDTQVWDAEANTKLRSMVGQQHRIGVLSWDKHLVSSGAQDGSIWHHDVRISQHKVMELNGHSDEVCGLQWRWDGTMLASGGNDNVVQVWDVRSNKPRLTKRHEGAVKALAWCPWNRHTLATGGGRNDRSIQVWNTSTSLRIHKIDTESQITSLHWSKHYKEIVSSHGYPNNQLTVWEYPSFNRIIDIPGHDSRILHTAMSPDGQMVATAAADENLKFWRIFEHDGRSKYDTKSILNNRPALVRSKSIR
ncbi:WD40-repeat-containing domain protein [Radiomyces spectabilis]|uniref:WD40-repeat-containing domain protein n=1 Tax=Radiomyces spectabilis TaxID=64574 RepID=UPI002220888E|nr:WD40-repeat-containing domain protein [Radiomyces spectabilis]KAI8364780.1 WD40-repeat-containing domain protein [Radiomyces spectabilis]